MISCDFSSLIQLYYVHIADLSQNQNFIQIREYLDPYSALCGFFVISGFLIGKSYNTTKNISDYFRKRARRLLPAYFASVLLFALLLSLFSSYSFSQYFTDKQFYKYLSWNLIFLNFVQPCLPGLFVNGRECAVNGALWTIKVEVLFYVIVPVLFYYLNKINHKYLLLVPIYIFSVVYKTYLESTGNSLMIVISRQTPGFLSYFACGFSFYFYFDFYIQHKGKLFVLAIPLFIIEYYYDLEILRPLALAVIMFFVAYSFPKLNDFGKRGDFSYGIYVFHFTLIQIFVQYDFFKLYNPFLMVVVVVVLVGILAVLSWNFIEKPFVKKKSKPVSVW